MDIGDATSRRAHASYTLLLRSLAEVSQKRVADMVGMSEASLSTFKHDYLERACLVIAACGLRIVPVTEHTYEEEDIAALRRLASRGLATIGPKRGGE